MSRWVVVEGCNVLDDVKYRKGHKVACGVGLWLVVNLASSNSSSLCATLANHLDISIKSTLTPRR